MSLEFNLTAINAYLLKPIDVITSANYLELYNKLYHYSKDILEIVSENLSSPITFTELQIFLLEIFLIIIAINLVLIGYYWNKYGGVITDRFIRPSKLT